MIALIDYGAGNLRSVANALGAAGASDVVITSDAADVARATRIVLPGVGAFGACIGALRAVPGLVDALDARVRGDGVPFLGICVGMQLLAGEGIEHGRHAGLGWIAGSVRAFDPAPDVRVPHMGWNDVTPAVPHPVIEGGEAYFLHGYHFTAARDQDVAATSSHGGPFVAAVARDNILGLQFHPEKSQRYGIATLERFLAWRR